VPGLLTDITELATALGTLADDLSIGLRSRPRELLHVPDEAWDRVVRAEDEGMHATAFETAFANGCALLHAKDGLRGRRPRLVEWKGPHRPPGDDVVPADLRIDHVYQVSCKYLSRITVNAGPARLFDRLLVGDERSVQDWFSVVAPTEYQEFYSVARERSPNVLPENVADLGRVDRDALREVLRDRRLPTDLQGPWSELCQAVSLVSAERWRTNLNDRRRRLRMLWRLLRIGDAPYFVLGADASSSLRLRLGSSWDWMQRFELRSFEVHPRPAGQPEVGWAGEVRDRASGLDRVVKGHVEIRWSHGRFRGSPEAKVYLDTHSIDVPGYHPLV